MGTGIAPAMLLISAHGTGRRASEITLTRTVVGAAHYAYVPFDVPVGTTRIDLAMTLNRRAVVGLGLFDSRGAGYQSAGFRGISGGERRDVFVGLQEATPGFLPGLIPAGRWTVILPVFLAVPPTRVTLRVRMSSGPDLVPSCRAHCRGSCVARRGGTAATCTVTPRPAATPGVPDRL